MTTPSVTPLLTPVDIANLNPPLNVTRVVDGDGLAKLQNFFDRTKATDGVIGWDIETTPLKDFFYRRCRTIQFGNQNEQYVIDLLPFCGGDSARLFDVQGDYGKKLCTVPALRILMDVLAPVLCTRDFLKVGVNLGFEYMNLYWLFGLRTQNFFDCMLVEKCIQAGNHSMKDYHFYSMEEMMARYFLLQIEKKYQESFILDGELTDEQIAYAALDTRFPLALRLVQMLILAGETKETLQRKGQVAYANLLGRLDPVLLGDNLVEIADIENDAIGAFQDMHVHGERIDTKRWLEKIAGKKLELERLVRDVLDPIFLPIVGSKLDVVTDEEVEAASQRWKSLNLVSDAELELTRRIRIARKTDLELFLMLEAEKAELERLRKAEKERLKEVCSSLSKKRTVLRNLADKCIGNALINYNSNQQLIEVLKGIKGLGRITNMDDETLEKFQHVPVMAAIKTLHSLQKEIGTYGDQWAMQWTTKPCKEEGWLHPGDGRLHCVFNQYDAETGRSSSEKPNGQNVPQGDIRQCFIADPPDESIRISLCCDGETHEQILETYGASSVIPVCNVCGRTCETKAEEYVIVTADMSGAELRILAELADDPVWIGAFERGEDVHSVGTELLYEEEWPQKALPGCAYFQVHTPETVAKNPNCTVGDPQRKKCKCPEHMELRDGNKSTNFLLAYGGTEGALAAAIKKAVTVARHLMHLHEQKNPDIWNYLKRSGKSARTTFRSFDMFGRRRIYPMPTWERAKERVKEYREEKLRLKPEETVANISTFAARYGRNPNKEEEWLLSHRQPTSSEIGSSLASMQSGIERQGKNFPMQATNVSIAKKAMGAGFCPAGKFYLWHTLPQYKAKLIKFVHDELVVQCPKRFGTLVGELIGDAFKRAAAEKMKKVVMESEFNVASYWKK